MVKRISIALALISTLLVIVYAKANFECLSTVDEFSENINEGAHQEKALGWFGEIRHRLTRTP